MCLTPIDVHAINIMVGLSLIEWPYYGKIVENLKFLLLVSRDFPSFQPTRTIFTCVMCLTLSNVRAKYHWPYPENGHHVGK